MKLLFVFMTMMFSVSAECNPSCYRGVCNDQDQTCVCHDGWGGTDCKTFQSCPTTTPPTYACSKDDECRAIDRSMTSSELICCDSKCVKQGHLKRGFACNDTDLCSGKCGSGLACIENICQDIEKASGCQCTKDDDCINSLYKEEWFSSDKICINEKCVSKNGIGHVCTANKTCKSNICQNGNCQASLPPGASCVGRYEDGPRCDLALKFCDKSLNGGTCVSKLDVGGDCQKDEQCFNDLYCGEGKCAAKIPVGQAKNISGYVWDASNCLSGTGETKMFGTWSAMTTQLTCRQKCCTTDYDCYDYNSLSVGSCVENKCSVATASQIRSTTIDPSPGSNFNMLGKFFPKCSKIFETMSALVNKYEKSDPDSVFNLPTDDQKAYAEFICCNICLYPKGISTETHPEAVIDCSTNSIKPYPNMDNACSFSQKVQGPDTKSTCPVGGYVPPSQPFDDGGCGALVVGSLLKAIPIFVLFLNF